jgi:tripartite-type tricarboxylate transporter receptor subunit TctC
MSITRRRISAPIVGGFCLAILPIVATPAPAAAQEISNRPITIIVPCTPGTGPDVMARMLADELKPTLPADAIGQTAAVFAALASAKGPIDVAGIAAGFRRTKALEPAIEGVLTSLARLGHAVTRDGRSFEIRRGA